MHSGYPETGQDVADATFGEIVARASREVTGIVHTEEITAGNQQTYLGDLSPVEQYKVLSAIEGAIVSTLSAASGNKRPANALIAEVARTLHTPADNVRVAVSRLLDEGSIDPDIGPDIALSR